MGFPRDIFKKYDIRGLVGSEMTDELSFAIGQAFCSMIASEIGRAPTVAVGRDMRESSPAYEDALVRGFTSCGAQVLRIGLVSTPAFYFGVGHTGADAGVMVSASHNPAAYNGFKLTRAKALPVSGENGIGELAKIVLETSSTASAGQPAERRDVSTSPVESRSLGRITDIEHIPALAARAEFAYAGSHPLKRFKIVADAANGMGAQYLDELFKLVDADVTRLYWDFDGSFPNHEADPFKEENTADVQKKVVELGADIGIATDGDGDRIFFVDDKGARVEPAVVRGMIAQIVLRSHPGATICYDIRPGRVTEDMIREAGGVPSVTRVGHSLIKEQMIQVGAPFGGESSGHFFFHFPTGVYEGPLTVAAMLLQEMTRLNKPLSQIVGPLCTRYAHSGEMNFDVQDKEAVIARLKEHYADGERNELDGVSITYPDFWFNVRGSNTEPKLRVNVEAIDRKTMEEKRQEIIEWIKRP